MSDYIWHGSLVAAGLFALFTGLCLTSAVMACLLTVFHHDDWVRERRHFYERMGLPAPPLAPLPNLWQGVPPAYPAPLTLEAT